MSMPVLEERTPGKENEESSYQWFQHLFDKSQDPIEVDPNRGTLSVAPKSVTGSQGEAGEETETETEDEDRENRHEAHEEEEGDQDMEQLVSSLKRGLRLKSSSCHSLSLSRESRVSPYPLNSNPFQKKVRSSCSSLGINSIRKSKEHRSGSGSRHEKEKRTSRSRDDHPRDRSPYQLMNELLEEGSLIKEAVKRLQRRKSVDRVDSGFQYPFYGAPVCGSQGQSLQRNKRSFLDL